ncbi:F-box protein CPR1-like [Rutidosis leptorrhynchoides]|uniref:F-box protein CPR1-like n=1 Tax=Rutidosis leptorrhynchoides TaxID=125765 RepID=UPI003A9A331A
MIFMLDQFDPFIRPIRPIFTSSALGIDTTKPVALYFTRKLDPNLRVWVSIVSYLLLFHQNKDPNSLTNMSDVPPVIVEILTHLPVRSLFRFRSVSKSWKDLIDSPYFINLHLNQSKKKEKICTLLEPKNHSTSLCLDWSSDSDKLVIPSNNYVAFDQIIGSCNGLLFLSKGLNHRDILLWNPSTRRHRFIQTPPIGYRPDVGYVFTTDAMGYDHENDDYKIVELSHYCEPNSNVISSNISVYSTKLNSWQLLLQDFPYRICEHEICEQRRWRGRMVSCSGSISHWVFIGGCINWVATQDPSQDTDYLIVSFDIARHNIELVEQPKYSSRYMAVDLGKLDECLCVVGYHETNCATVDVWVMGTYRVIESWKKLVTVTMPDVRSVRPCVRPLTYLKNGKELMFEVGHKLLVRYDLENETKTIIPNGLSGFYAIRCVYHESLLI